MVKVGHHYFEAYTSLNYDIGRQQRGHPAGKLTNVPPEGVMKHSFSSKPLLRRNQNACQWNPTRNSQPQLLRCSEPPITYKKARRWNTQLRHGLLTWQTTLFWPVHII